MPEVKSQAESSSPLSAPAARVFHLFSKLPTELRLKIWDLNLPPPRVVSIKCGDWPRTTRCSTPDPGEGPSSRSCTSSAPIPANLHTCHEARKDALRRYGPLFGIAQRPGRVFFDPERDVLYLGSRDGFAATEAQARTFMALTTPADLTRVRRLALNDAIFCPAFVDPEFLIAPWHYFHYQQQLAAAELRRMNTSAAELSFPPLSPELINSVTDASVTQAIEILWEVARRMPSLRELIFVPYDANPVYSAAACLVPLATDRAGMERRIRTALAGVAARQARPPILRSTRRRPGGNGNGGPLPPFRIMTLSAVPHPVVHKRRDMGLEGMTRLGVIQEELMGRFDGCRKRKVAEEEE